MTVTIYTSTNTSLLFFFRCTGKPKEEKRAYLAVVKFSLIGGQELFAGPGQGAPPQQTPVGTEISQIASVIVRASVDLCGENKHSKNLTSEIA